jgi:peptidoglycan/LPS O-acetylase OafA/YrhL
MAAAAPRLVWPDVVRVLAAASIFFFHFTGDYARLDGSRSAALPRYVEGHSNLWGIAAFVVLSGFSLALTLLPAEHRRFRGYVARRLTRIYAPYSLVLGRRREGASVMWGLLAAALLVAGAPLLWRLGARTDVPTFAVLAVVFVACGLFVRAPRRPHGWVAAAAALTYVFYLSHAPVTKYSLEALFRVGLDSLWVALPVVAAVALGVAWIADWVARRFVSWWVGWGVGRLLHPAPEGPHG